MQLSSLYQYLRYAVPELNRRHGKPQQTPYISADPPTKLHLVLLPKQATFQDVMTLKNDALSAEVTQDLELAEQLWTRVLVASPGDQDAIRAIKRIDRLLFSTATNEKVAESENPSGEAQALTPTAQKPLIHTTSFEFTVVTLTGRKIGGMLGFGGEMEVERRLKQAKHLIEDLGDGVSLDMVEIPGGRFLMGSSTEGPQHEVNVSAFLMGRYPITQAQWRAIVTQVPKIQRELEPDPSGFKGDNRPVEKVSWLDAVEFCARLTQKTGQIYRLPSEAEWEYACRAGTTTPFHFGETITPDLVNYDGNYTYGSGPKGKYRKETTPVGSFKVANGFGLCDMHGNVWEWCADPWHSSYDGAPNDGNVWDENNNDNRYQVYSDENLVNLLEDNRLRIVRGGSWDDFPRYCRSVYRVNSYPDLVSYFIGFRVVRILPRALQ